MKRDEHRDRHDGTPLSAAHVTLIVVFLIIVAAYFLGLPRRR